VGSERQPGPPRRMTWPRRNSYGRSRT
jgi:hypothetical protein